MTMAGVVIINAQTGEVIERDFTPEELAQREAAAAAAAAAADRVSGQTLSRISQQLISATNVSSIDFFLQHYRNLQNTRQITTMEMPPTSGYLYIMEHIQ